MVEWLLIYDKDILLVINNTMNFFHGILVNNYVHSREYIDIQNISKNI